MNNLCYFTVKKGSGFNLYFSVAAMGNVDAAVFFEIGIVSHSLTDFAVTAENDFSVFAKELIGIFAVGALNVTQLKHICNFGSVSQYKISHVNLL